MTHYFEKLVGAVWNRIASGTSKTHSSDLKLGSAINDGAVSRLQVRIPHKRRAEHIAILGKTGTGKSSLLKNLVLQDIVADRGFVFFDLHGDAQGFLLAAIAEQERVRKLDLSHRLILIEPADFVFSVGLNVLEFKGTHRDFVQISELAELLKHRWHLDALGARTEELLRNALYALSECQLTLLELAPLLTNEAFREHCLRHVRNPEVRSYFETRYDSLSQSMQGAFREAVLNKTTAFTADPHFRHILGQQQSSFSLSEAMDNGYWIVLNLDKGRLGEQSATLGSLFLAKLKNAVFARRSRELFTLYCDEIQNLVSLEGGIDTLLSEARKFAVGVCSANQFLDQYPPKMKAAILAVGTHVLFQLSNDDASKMAQALGGGRQLGEVLRHLPHRNIVVKSSHHRWKQALVPNVRAPATDFRDLYERCRNRWAKRRTEVERAIQTRQRVATEAKEVLDEWD
jgi:hypothetical protein